MGADFGHQLELLTTNRYLADKHRQYQMVRLTQKDPRSKTGQLGAAGFGLCRIAPVALRLRCSLVRNSAVFPGIR